MPNFKAFLPLALSALLLAVGCGDDDGSKGGAAGTLGGGGSGGTLEPGEGGAGGADDPGDGGSGGSEDPGEGGTGGSEEPGEGGAGGEGGEGGEGPVAASFEFGTPDCPFGMSPGCFQVQVGQSRQFTVVVKDEDGAPIPDATVTWESEDESIATVVDGLVTVHDDGEVDIMVTSGGYSEPMTITASWLTFSRLSINEGNFFEEQGTYDALEGKTLTLQGMGIVPGRFGMETAHGPVDPEWEVGDSTIATIEEAFVHETSGYAFVILRALEAGATTLTLRVNPKQHPDGADEYAHTVDIEVWSAQINPAEFKVSDFEVGGTFACAVSSSSPYCWGDNSEGQLGIDGPYFHRAVPSKVAGGRTFVTMAPGVYHGCGLEADGSAWCWGAGHDGQLGADETEGQVNSSTVPLPAAGAMKFKALATGAGHTCGIDLDDALWCWGYNLQGRLGIGEAGAQRHRVPAKVDSTKRFEQIGLADSFGCALDTENAAWCWGYGGYGSLGMGQPDGSPPARQNSPVAVVGGHRFTQIEVGGVHACGLREDKTVWCWGGGASGQLGVEVANAFEPVQVSGEHLFEKIALGSSHSCGIDTDGKGWCWGENAAGQLGTGDTIGGHLPAPVFGDLVFTEIRAGGETTCGNTADGLYCWGGGQFGQLGNGSTANRPLPMVVTKPAPDLPGPGGLGPKLP